MKPTRSHSKILLAAWVLSFGTALILPSALGAPAEAAALPGARSGALAWLQQIDSGDYTTAYHSSCVAFREQVKPKQWNDVLTVVRKPLGPPSSRQEAQHEYAPEGADGLGSPCLTFAFVTTFAGTPYSEVVAVKLEDGEWIGAGYHVGPYHDPNDNSPAPAVPNTEIKTEVKKPEEVTHEQGG